jgi:hypothetical protein
MQPLAILAIALGVVMITGVSATLVLTRHHAGPADAAVNHWQRHGTIPLAGAGLVLGVISRANRGSPATHNVVFAVTVALLLSGLVCALIGAARASQAQRSVRE